ncbi:MAG: hypothetical protein HYS13_22125 [Planctomycetia bacterium]|nr:hypothetical protein [Planctomycetia bacterium]
MTAPQPPENGPRPRRYGCIVALLLGFVILGGLLASAILAGTFTLAFVGVVAAIFGSVVLHYLVWGRWLGERIREDVQREEEE